MRFVGRLAIILLVAVGAAVAHSMQWPITRDGADALARRDAQRQSKGGQSDTSGETTAPPRIEDPAPEAVDPPEIDQGTEDEDAGSPDLPEYYISVEDAYAFWEEGMAFIDARTDAERAVGTIEGAFHLQTKDFIAGPDRPGVPGDHLLRRRRLRRVGKRLPAARRPSLRRGLHHARGLRRLGDRRAPD